MTTLTKINRFGFSKILCASIASVFLTSCGSSGGNGQTARNFDLKTNITGAMSSVPSTSVFTFSVTVINSGPDTAENVAVQVGAGASLITVKSCTATAAAICPTTLAGDIIAPTIPSGGALNFQIEVTPVSGANTSLSLTAKATATGDNNGVNDATVIATQVYSTDVALSVTSPTGPVPSGSPSNFQVELSNNGPALARSLSLNAAIPGAALGGAITCTASNGATCPTSTSLSISIPELPQSGRLTFSMPMTFSAGTNAAAGGAFEVVVPGDVATGNNRVLTTTNVYSSDIALSLANLTAADPNSRLGAVGSAGTLGYLAVISNTGPSAESSIVLTSTPIPGATLSAQSCSATGGAVCPVLPAAGALTLPSLPVGGTLEIIYHVVMPVSTRGLINLTLSASAPGDILTTNNVASAQTSLDSRNDEYLAYSLDGSTYPLAVNFNSGAYSIGSNPPAYGRLRLESNGNFSGFGMGGPAFFSIYDGLRYKDDVIVGRLTFSGLGTQFIAARNFVSNLANLSGNMNVLGRNVTGTGNYSMHFTAQWQSSGTKLVFCGGSVLTPVATCNPSNLLDYTVSGAGPDFTATDVVHADTLTFRVAKMGGAMIYLRSGRASDGTNNRFRIGLPEGPATLSSTSYPWGVSTSFGISSTLTDTSYVSSPQGPMPGAINAILAVYSPQISGLRQGPNTTNWGAPNTFGALIEVMQGPLAVMMGNSTGALSGVMEISIP